MNDHIEPTKYFVVAASVSDYHDAVRAANLPPMSTFPSGSLRDAIFSVAMNTEFSIECVVCCTDAARLHQDIPETVRSVQSVAFDPDVRHENLFDIADRLDP